MELCIKEFYSKVEPIAKTIDNEILNFQHLSEYIFQVYIKHLKKI